MNQRNSGLMDLPQGQVLSRSGNAEHAPRFEMSDFPPLGGSSGMIMGKGELESMGMGGHGIDSVLLQQAREKMQKAENGQGGRMWWPNLLDLDSVQDGKTIHTSSDHPGADFIQSKEDFPALPSLKQRSDPSMHSRIQRNGERKSTNGMQGVVQSKLIGAASPFQRKKQLPPPKEGLQDKAEEEYGLKGLLRVIRMTDPGLNTLALGTDLTKLGLNLNSSDALYATFAYPCAAEASRVYPDFVLPYCYYMQPPALKTSHLGKFELLTLFYIFYNMPKDTLQVYAAKELYNREWRYHKELKMWFKRPSPSESLGNNLNRGQTLMYFDINHWEQRIVREVDELLPAGQKFMTEMELNQS
mmetsp:Transcript_7655/g.11592  ORF Transcript_7655/g.11592 Transcript_7655/m.11592 type:complete len:357 (-) Transcript_7655:123-1193(-)